ncbi:MAG: hypothetical protein JKY24_08635 [Pseudomonadales bacterium]|nr:hypothetical protein [Pseudomonadales bacterium]
MDSPVPIFFWDPPEAIMAILLIGLGIVFGSLLGGLVLAMICLSAAKKLKEGAKPGQAQHVLWSKGIEFDPRLKMFPGPTRKEFYN